MSLTRRILLITPGFADGEEDSFTIPALQEYVQGIKKYKPHWELVIFAFDFPYRKEPYMYHGFKVYPLNGRNKSWKKPRTFRKGMALFEELHHETPFQFIHSFWLTDSALVGQQLAKKWDVPHMCTAMGQDVQKGSRYLRVLKHHTFPVAYLSKYQQERSSISIKKEDIIIPWGMDSLQVNAVSKDIDVIGVGNLTPLKNFDAFLEVLVEVKRTRENLKAYLVGYGPLEAKLNQRIDLLGLTENVKLSGKLSRRETLECMARSKVLLHTSTYESFGMVFIEAQAMGCRVVSTPVGIAQDVGTVDNSQEKLARLVVDALSGSGNVSGNSTYHIQDTISRYSELYGFE